MQENEQKIYIAIDLKSFYASVECKERGLDPITTNLVVADNSRTEKTICLAVSPSLKSYGIPGRARLFEVIQKVKEVNIERRRKAPNESFTGSSYDDKALKKSATKVCGPQINKTGNFCIAGHNYQSVFGKLKYLKIGDVIKLTDTYNRNVEYKIYSIEKVSPNNIDCLSQNTNGEREVTLITCTLGAVKRIVVKAIEIYDWTELLHLCSSDLQINKHNV